MMSERQCDLAAIVRRAGRIGGPLLALLCYALLPDSYVGVDGTVHGLSAAGRGAAAMMCWMALWWMTEAVPIEATALLPVLAFPLFGIATLGTTTAAYGSDIVFLFLGGFVLAAAIQRWGLDRRIAFATLRVVGARPGRVLAGLMAATAFMSMWVSNTATAAMMVPIAQSVIALHADAGASAGGRDRDNFALALLLSIAYAASIGGLGTIVGSPPNGIAVRFLEQTYGRGVSFLQWMVIALPVVAVFLPLAGWLLTRVLFPFQLAPAAQGREWIAMRWRSLGPPGAGERVTLAVFAVTVMLWITRPLLVDLEINDMRPLRGLSDAGIAIGAAIALFMLPVGRGAACHAMDWRTAQSLPWGVLVLFGGGLALAGALEGTGVAHFIGSQARTLEGWPLWAVLLLAVAATTFLSEVTSNTAQVATMIPVLAALAPVLGIEPTALVVTCTLASSLAFMLPVGTPPNAIVFGTGHVTIGQMCRAGFLLNLIGIAIVVGFAYFVLPRLLTVTAL